MDRVGAGSIHCENLAVSIYGNIQPTVFKQNLDSLAADGLLQRFIPGILRAGKTKLGQPVPECMTSAAAWENTLRLTYSLPPQTYQLSFEAYMAYREFQSWYEDAKRDERVINSGDVYMTAFGKLEGLTGRLILLFHIIESPFMPQVQADIVHRVVSLVRGYIIPAYRYAFGEVGGAIEHDFDQWVIDYIVQISSDVQTITLRDLKKSARRPLEGKTDWQKEQTVMDAMLTLENAGWVVQVENELNKKRITWAINPSISEAFKDYRKHVLKAKQRHADYIYRYATAKGYERKIVRGYNPETMDDKKNKYKYDEDE
jgi:hypothetical protein